METKTEQQLHIFFLPFMAQGHTLPLIDIAKLFASRGVKSTLITTLVNAPLFSKAIQTSKSLGFEIELLVIKFPSTEVGLPEGIERTNLRKKQEQADKYFRATNLLEQQVEPILDQHRPHCLVADSLFPWATDVAAKFGIPRIIFHGPGFFPLCASTSVMRYQPQREVSSDSESFVVPGLPDEIKMTKNKLAPFLTLDGESELIKVVTASQLANETSYGIIVNSFYELEPAYADHYRKVFGRKAWHIGPASLCETEKDKLQRGRKARLMKYMSLLEIALALEASRQQFIWVVKKENNDKEEWLPEGFEQRVEGKGLIIRGWAPQLLILQHEAVGAFLTYCGWNSTLEAVCAGIPMITWPVSADQFYNEKLVTQILGIGVAVGVEKWEDDSVKSEASMKKETIEKAVTEFMVSHEKEEMRSKILELRDLARRAVEEGGSSFLDLTALIEELKSLRF
ncbi:putative flavonol 3-O-glucosyltransferase [Rosa chinensis]|uniref:Putative flavonol 3-O-glucosyltransferase n=1 Tax=Rosa chinensis TaxID=74649 RepID=A0A2P6PM43_ROSCH|nr:putative flavonol 3-O-glucosyltransferase [Rosa chinensis]